MVKRLLTLVLALGMVLGHSQSRPGSLQGTVKDKRTGEVIPFATAMLKTRMLLSQQERQISMESII